MEISSSQLDRMFSFEDQSLSLYGMFGRGLGAQVARIVADERRYLKEQIAPITLSEDLKHAEDHDYLSWELLRRAGRHGRLTHYIPKFMGGIGGPTTLMAFFSLMEEMGAVDCAYTGMLGGHLLGLFVLAADLKTLFYCFDQTVAHQRDERPYVVSLAITEPSAGTDVEEYELYDRAKLICHARRAPGGAVLNGRKVFISTGHMATDHAVILPFDLKDPRNSMGIFLVNKDLKGFSLGRKERKMGQRAGPASELIFEDCFVPSERIVMDPERFGGRREVFRDYLEFALGGSRTAVAAWSVGTARGALERSVELAATTEYRGEPLIAKQWVQAILAEMLLTVCSARAVYLEAQYALMLAGSGRGRVMSVPGFIGRPPFTRVTKWGFERLGVRRALSSDWVSALIIRRWRSMPDAAKSRLQTMSSLAKVAGSDAAMKVAGLAVEMMGRAGVRHDQGLEKIFRDAKLLQIFEGTNQLNRLNAFNHFFARHLPGVKVY